MDHIEIVLPRMKRSRETHEILEDFSTLTFRDVVYTPEVRPPSPRPDDSARTSLAAEEPLAAVHSEDQSEDQPVDDEDAVEGPVEHFSPESFYAKFVARSPERCISELCAPQRSLQWLAARAHAITASSFGAAAGHNPYCSPKDLVIEKLWRTFVGNEYTQYGTFHEPDARETFLRLLNGPLRATLNDVWQRATGALAVAAPQFELFETGLIKSAHQPWMAVSPDGLVRLPGPNGTAPVWALVEYKCPARLRDSEAHPYKKDRANVPKYYMDQMQGIMGLLNKYPELLDQAAASQGLPSVGGPSTVGPQVAFFVVWQPHQIHVTRVPFDFLYFKGTLEPALERWFFDLYLPYATLKANGELVDGTLTAARPIVLDS